MSDTIDDFRFLKGVRAMRRRMYGVPCPSCLSERPRGHPTLLLPQQRCRVDHYRDPRPELTDQQEQAIYDAVNSEASANA